MNEVKVDIKRAVASRTSLVSMIIMTVIISIGVGGKQLFPANSFREGLFTYYHAHILLSSLSSDIVLMAVPIICTLPYTTAFLEEYTSGYIKVYLMKCEKSLYIKGKVIAPIISGGLVLFLGVIVFFFLSKIIYSPLERYSEYAIPPFMNILMKAVQFFFAGALWSGVGSLMSNVSLSKYMAYASPFVFFYVLVILQERYFRELYVLNPKEWLLVQNSWPLGAWGAIILMALLTFITCLINTNIIERRIDG